MLALPSSTLAPFTTTNAYLIANNGVGVLVDPGFHEEESLEAVRAALEQAGVRLLKAVLLTHTHGDHCAGLELVGPAFGEAPVYAHPAELARLASTRAVGLEDERVLMVGDTIVRALHTPGHSPGHLCFHAEEEGVIVAGDLVAGTGSVWVGVPEGDVEAYLASLQRLAAIPGLKRLGPGHGPVVSEPYARLEETRLHRLERESQVLEALASPRTLHELRDLVYPQLPDALRSPAEATLLAHLRRLMSQMRVVHLGTGEQGPFVRRS